VRAEIVKLRTTPAWWRFIGGFAALIAVTALFGWLSHNAELHPPPDLTNEAEALAQAAADRTPAGAAKLAASLMTSGQALLVLVTLLFSVYVVTGEYAARTMTSTLLVTPHRRQVIGAKLATAVGFGVGCWAFATVVDGVMTPVFLAVEHLPSGAWSSWDVLRAVVRGLLAYALWALFGLGLGAVLRNQTAAVVAAMVIYAAGYAVVALITNLLYDRFHASWLLGLAVVAPAEASHVMIAPGRAFHGAPPWWVGALVLAGYGVVLAGFGAAALRRKDVS
jgi:hypothetical protein